MAGQRYKIRHWDCKGKCITKKQKNNAEVSAIDTVTV